MNVALLGIGLMGFPMGRRFLEAGFELRAWSRTPGKAERLVPSGARACATAAEATQDADCVVTMLEHGEAVESVIFAQGAAAAMRPGSVLVDMSSIAPQQARDHGTRLHAMGLAYLDAPVSGGTLGAEQGTLAIMAGGEASTFEQALALFAPLGRATLVGPTGCGQLCKLANQMIVGITIGAVAEALLLCARNGADVHKVKEAIAGGFADSKVLQVHGQRMLDNDFAPRGRVSVQLKDLRNALSTASASNFVAPITALLEGLYADAAHHGDADLDHAALHRELARRNGMLTSNQSA